MLTKKIVKCGSSKAIRLPADFLKILELNLGDIVKIDIKDNKIIITPVKNQKKE